MKKTNLNSKLIEKKLALEEDVKKLYESRQNIKSKEEKIGGFNNDIKRIKNDIEGYAETSQKILTELKKIESYELDIKIKEYKSEINIFNILLQKSNNNDLIECSKKIKIILENIKDVVKTIQSNEYELAKKNEQIKNDIDRKISSETKRLSEIILNLEHTREIIISSGDEINNLESVTKNSKLEIQDITNKFNNASKLFEQEKNNLHELELKNETKKVKISNLVSNIESNNSELKSMSGNIELLKDNNNSPDNKLVNLEITLEDNLKVQNIKDLELKEIRLKITDFTNQISSLDKSKLETSNIIEAIRYEISEDEKIFKRL